ncbi:MAG: hypothetical protein AAF515_02485 [Pseudomonadota bacterium]
MFSPPLSRLSATSLFLLSAMVLAIALSSKAAAQDGDLQAESSDVAQTVVTEPATDVEIAARLAEDSLSALGQLVEVQAALDADIREVTQEISATDVELARKELEGRLAQLQKDYATTRLNIAELATGTDVTLLFEQEQPAFDFETEVLALLEPLVKEVKGMTQRARTKSAQKDRAAYYNERIPVVEEALQNIGAHLEDVREPAVQATLIQMREDWQQQLKVMRSQLQAAEVQIAKLEAEEQSLAEASEGYVRDFVRNRGRTLALAIGAVIGIILLGRLIIAGVERIVPGYRREFRSFQIRLIDLVLRLGMVILAIFAPLAVFYFAADWVLFSVGVLILLGIALALREALPRFWYQIELFMNVGTVREGERVELRGLPWRVRRINFYTELDNPTADMRMRVKIDDLVDLRSRPHAQHEPWFPCRLGEWVLYESGRRGQVVGLSPELVQLEARGGAIKTFATPDFIAAAPVNLSRNFRIKETFGISYDLQKIATTTAVAQLREFVAQHLDAAGYGEDILNLQVEFENASSSALDLVVIADCHGRLGEIYNRMRRTIQAACVGAANEYGWEIPFDQLTVHQA